MKQHTLLAICILSLSGVYGTVCQADPFEWVKDHYSQRMSGPYFPDQELLFDVFGTYAVTRDGQYNDGFGGGVGLQYFMTRYLGFGAEAYWWDGDSVIHTFSGDVVLRYPLEATRLAPYLLAGGSAHVNSIRQFSGHAGLGVDWRVGKGAGLFADGRYVLTERTNDYVLFRLGLRIALW